MLFTLPALEVDRFGATALAEYAGGGALVELAEPENSELRGCGVGVGIGVVFVGSGDFDTGLTSWASFVGLGGFSSCAVSTTGGRALGFGAATLFGLVVAILGAGLV
jgi:hypothetical protein